MNEAQVKAKCRQYTTGRHRQEQSGSRNQPETGTARLRQGRGASTAGFQTMWLATFRWVAPGATPALRAGGKK